VILCAGLTPAWQQILVFDGFRYGEVNRASEAHWCASGKVFNAGIAAHTLGGPSLTLAPVGGPAMEQIAGEFRQLGVPHRWIKTAASTRVCTTILDRRDGTMTELVEEGRPLTAAEQAEFLDAYAEEAARSSAAVIIGSLPRSVPETFYRALLERTPCPAVLDFRGPGLLDVLDLEPYVIKPNREELARTVGRPLDNDSALVDAMRSLNGRGASWVVVTQGDGPVWMTSSTQTFRLHPARVEPVVNPIGSGDALAATIAWATGAGHSAVDAVRLGLGAAAENLGQLLPCRLDAAKVTAWADRVRVEAF
jgi:1-phosphofructokinase family hexose kinase